MNNILSYHVYDSRTRQWFDADDGVWTTSFHRSTAYGELAQANNVMQREDGDYVFACMASP